jgi:outer membrane protein assembly factor BamB
MKPFWLCKGNTYIVLTLLIAIGGLALRSSPAHAQQCGVADSLRYPVDTSLFHLAQDFGAPSPRHQGRYHTGEDWYIGRAAENNGVGLPVVAAANGRVTYSAPGGWGRDGGVVIIEHTFPDGSLLYTQYGHMMQTDTIRFPAQWSCVRAGDVIGGIGNIRPAPHLHFEVRASDGSSPGPGYSWDDPTTLGFRQPSKFIRNGQAWLHPAYRWRLDLADESGPVAPPLELDDHSLLYIDANRLGRVTPDGRSLWRINLERPAAAVTRFNGGPLLTYADGSMQRVNLDGTLAERWETGVALDAPVIIREDMLIFHTPDNGLVAFGPDRQTVLWTVPDVPPVVRAEAAAQVIGLLTENNQILSLSLHGQLLHQAQLREPASLVSAPNGELRAYTAGGLWAILADGTWALDLEDAPRGSRSGAALYTTDGELYLYDGSVLHAYDQSRTLKWQVRLPDSIGGLTQLADMGTVLLLTSSYGNVLAVQKQTGSECGATQVFGSDRSRFWHSLGDDGILRVAVSDQILGFHWRTFLGGCAN